MKVRHCGSFLRPLHALVFSSVLVLGGCHSALTSAPPLPSPGQDFVASSDHSQALTFPDTTGAPVDDTAADNELVEAQELINQWSLEQRVASLFLVHVPGSTLMDFQQIVQEYPVAGFLILRDNLSRDSAQATDFLHALQSTGTPDRLVAVDQEGGAVERLGGDNFPTAPELGQKDPVETMVATSERNALVREFGANLNLGIVADVSPGPGAYIHRRSFGEDTDVVAQRVSAAYRGAVDGVALAVKHFPGHGLTDVDTHRHLATSAVTMDQWRATHLPPFEAAIGQGAPVVMLSHIVVTEVDPVPASLSKTWVDFLREELGFAGVIATDDLSMLEQTGESTFDSFADNAVAAVAAGVDLIVDAGADESASVEERLGRAIEAVVDAVESGNLDEARIDAAAVRVLALRFSLGGVEGPLDDTQVSELGG